MGSAFSTSSRRWPFACIWHRSSIVAGTNKYANLEATTNWLVHAVNGWQFVADSSSAFASEYLGPLAFEDMSGAAERLQKAREILQEHGHYDWLTETGNFVCDTRKGKSAIFPFLTDSTTSSLLNLAALPCAARGCRFATPPLPAGENVFVST